MAERYNGGFKGANLYSSRSGDTSGVFDLKAQHTFNIAEKWSTTGPLPISASTYDATGLGPVTSITDLEEYAESLPREFFLRYTMIASGVTTKQVTSRVKNENGKFSQSIFTLADALSISNITSILPYANDDHDSLLMEGRGHGVLARNNTDTAPNVTGWDMFKGTTIVAQNTNIDVPFPFAVSQTMFTGSQTLVIAFPGTEETLYFNLQNQRYSLSGSSYGSIPSDLFAAINPGTTTQFVRNTMLTMSDGVNSFLVYKYGNPQAVIIEMNMRTRLIYKYEFINFSAATAGGNSTEEDVVGDQLFTINGSLSWAQGGYFYYSRGLSGGTSNQAPGWRTVGGLITTGMTTTIVGAGISTQTGYDIISSIDASNRVWFADWGHDNGGIFNFGNDSQLGVGQTNIYKIGESELGVL